MEEDLVDKVYDINGLDKDDDVDDIHDIGDLDKDNVDEIYFISDKLYEQGKYIEAIISYTKILSYNEDKVFKGDESASKSSSITLLYLGYLHRTAAFYECGEYASALSDANRCIALNDTWVPGYLKKADCQIILKQYSDAIATLNKAIEVDVMKTHKDLPNVIAELEQKLTGNQSIAGNNSMRTFIFEWKMVGNWLFRWYQWFHFRIFYNWLQLSHNIRLLLRLLVVFGFMYFILLHDIAMEYYREGTVQRKDRSLTNIQWFAILYFIFRFPSNFSEIFGKDWFKRFNPLLLLRKKNK